MATPIIGITELVEAQDNAYVTVNTALRILEALSYRANSMSTDTQPNSPSNADVYILLSFASPAGAEWSTFSTDDVVVYDSGAWVGFTPWAGLKLWVEDIENFVVFDGTNWVVARDRLSPLKIEDRDLAVLPTSPIPASGQAYIVANASPQSYATDTIAIADGVGGWVTITPEEGDLVYIKDEQVYSSYATGSPIGWSAGTSI